MSRGLVEESGMFRTRPVGVVDREGHILHFGTLPQYVPNLVMELLDWAKNSKVHTLIRSCVFHYEFELIHPFADGNGRVGRLWHTLSVSYTHLDVYKRQVFAHSSWMHCTCTGSGPPYFWSAM